MSKASENTAHIYIYMHYTYACVWKVVSLIYTRAFIHVCECLLRYNHYKTNFVWHKNSKFITGIFILFVYFLFFIRLRINILCFSRCNVFFTCIIREVSIVKKQNSVYYFFSFNRNKLYQNDPVYHNDKSYRIHTWVVFKKKL